MSPEPPLAVLQRWMQAVLMHPAGASAGLRSPAARAQLDAADRAETVVLPSPALGAVERLQVYAGAYFARLLECLRAEYPVLRRAVGEDLFDELAVGYLARHPSRSYTLGRLGADFAADLEATRPREAGGGPDWGAFLVELARFEWGVNEVFDGPGVEGLPPFDAGDLANGDPESFAAGRLQTAPCLRLFAFAFPVNRYWGEAKAGPVPPPPAPAPSWAALSRRDYVVRRHDLSRAQFALLSSLQRGETVGAALADAAEAWEGAEEAFPAALRGWFAAWREARLVTGFAAAAR